MKNIGPIPWLPEGRIVSVPDRGEFFVRHFQHSDPSAPTLLLLHGWTASSDVQFFTAYEELAQHYSFVGIDHRGHGRGIRPTRTFSLEECADDAAAVVRALGIKRVITVGYSMGASNIVGMACNKTRARTVGTHAWRFTFAATVEYSTHIAVALARNDAQGWRRSFLCAVAHWRDSSQRHIHCEQSRRSVEQIRCAALGRANEKTNGVCAHHR